MPVYFITENEASLSPIKIGFSKNISKRIKELQTGNPSKLLLMGWLTSPNDAELEKSLHRQFSLQRCDHGEWFDINHEDIFPILRQAGINGYVAKNASVFEIISRDNDAIPELLGICNWVDLDFEQCCPYCGCLCGMQFIEAAEMYHCSACQVLTNFETPEDENNEA